MVVFACNACGASVKKNQVEKHYTQQCRRCESLSCMDCGKDFWGEDYKHHNKCISEDQKYAAKGWQPKASANKGERKQEAWIEAITAAVDEAQNMSPALRQLLTNLTQYTNIPRKKKKFENFVSNSVHVRNYALVEQAWQVFEKAIAKPQQQAPQATVGEQTQHEQSGAPENGAVTENGTDQQQDGEEAKQKKKKRKEKPAVVEEEVETEPKEQKKSKRERKLERSKKMLNGAACADSENAPVKKKKNKRKLDDIENLPEEETAPENGIAEPKQKKKKKSDAVVEERLNATLDESALVPDQRSGKFDWTGVVLAVLGGAPERELPLKKLRKKVVAEYQSRGCDGRTDLTREQIWAKLDKRLHKMGQVKLFKDHAKLISA